ncbi:hypothetical protein GCM10010363_60690 [Streptomyces omiyaensis]|uniref:RNA polymerase sigma factor n=1 Tax=Streptomyces omiyaensis TaxID=68247 RepID=UPI001673D587|nr:sigma-70 family RNA polymerase sigma factor [Streptomyces omiyaensis]GGY71297.1 hypothetical protein GCM10010363_60690 [Streptomyces omiyaensis]
MPDHDDTPLTDELLAVHHDKGQALLRLARRELAAENLPAADAEDIVQDAFLTTFINSRETTIDNPYAYLCAVIRNRVKDISRRKTAALLDTTAPTAEAHSVLWVSDLAEEDTDAILDTRPALQELTEPQRRYVLLNEGWGYTQAEIAELTGAHKGTVATHIRRAKIALLATLGTLAAALLVSLGHRALTEQLHWISTSPAGRPDDTGSSLLALAIVATSALGLASRIRPSRRRRRRRRRLTRTGGTLAKSLSRTLGEWAASAQNTLAETGASRPGTEPYGVLDPVALVRPAPPSDSLPSQNLGRPCHADTAPGPRPR